MIKLDTQGTEHEILAHGDLAVDKALLIESEVEFVEMYQNQKLFHDICGHLYEKHFRLLYLNRVFISRKKYKGDSRGQMVFGDALFGLNEKAVAKLPWIKKKKYCALLINYGLTDYAYAILQSDKELQAQAPDLINFFERQTDEQSFFSKLRRVLFMQLEKPLVLLLFLRRTNQLPADSDRSWPVR